MKTIATTLLALFALSAVLFAVTPAQAQAVEDSILSCWVHPHTMEVRTPQEEAAHLARETVSCPVGLAQCVAVHSETRQYRTPEQWVEHYVAHADECL